MPNMLDETHQGGTFVSANYTRALPPADAREATGAEQQQGSL
jgi:uronate dehydrogenase